MKKFRYEIAGYLCEIVFRDACNGEALLPSYCPFATEKSGELLFCCVVTDAFRLGVKGAEIGQFDCGGNNFGVYRLQDGAYQFEICNEYNKLCALMQVSPDFSQSTVALVADEEHERRFGLNNALMLVFAFSSAPRHTLLMHSSVIRNGGVAYCFLGKSGTGKSTHTSLWRRYIPGSDLMNDDNPVVRVIDGMVFVYGSPWSGKTPCYRQVSAPVGAFVQLRQCAENKISRMSVLACMASLLPSISTMKWDKRIYGMHCETLSLLIGNVPVWLLDCLPDQGAAELSYKTLTATYEPGKE